MGKQTLLGNLEGRGYMGDLGEDGKNNIKIYQKNRV
jgi:hypothetical protein